MIEFFPLEFYTTSHPFLVLNILGIMFQKFEQNMQQCGKSVFCRVFLAAQPFVLCLFKNKPQIFNDKLFFSFFAVSVALSNLCSKNISQLWLGIHLTLDSSRRALLLSYLRAAILSAIFFTIAANFVVILGMIRIQRRRMQEEDRGEGTTPGKGFLIVLQENSMTVLQNCRRKKT